MNTCYHWTNDEIVVAEHMKDVRREADQARLLRTAGIAVTSGRIIVALANALIRIAERLRSKYAHTHQVYKTPGGKYAA